MTLRFGTKQSTMSLGVSKTTKVAVRHQKFTTSSTRLPRNVKLMATEWLISLLKCQSQLLRLVSITAAEKLGWGGIAQPFNVDILLSIPVPLQAKRHHLKNAIVGSYPVGYERITLHTKVSVVLTRKMSTLHCKICLI